MTLTKSLRTMCFVAFFCLPILIQHSHAHTQIRSHTHAHPQTYTHMLEVQETLLNTSGSPVCGTVCKVNVYVTKANAPNHPHIRLTPTHRLDSEMCH